MQSFHPDSVGGDFVMLILNVSWFLYWLTFWVDYHVNYQLYRLSYNGRRLLWICLAVLLNAEELLGISTCLKVKGRCIKLMQDQASQLTDVTSISRSAGSK